MQSTRVVFLMIILALAATAAFAQTCGCGTAAYPVVTTAPVCTTCPTVTCPACPAPEACTPPCPTAAPAACGAGPACPAPTCGTCPAPPPAGPCGCGMVAVPAPPVTGCGCAAPVSVPSCAIAAGFGGGPLDTLVNAPCGCGFDQVYLQAMFPLHADIIALATEGENRATSRNLRDLSAKIRHEQMDQNAKIAMWANELSCGQVCANYCAPSTVTQCLCSLTGDQFDLVYAQTMSDMLMKLRDSAALGATRLQDPRIINQAQLVTRVSQNEIDALQGWIQTHAGGPTLVPAPAYAPTPTVAVPVAPAVAY